MAGTLTIQTLVDGSRNTVIKATFGGDADLTNAVLFDASTAENATTNNKIMRIDYGFIGFSAKLTWDATVDVPIISLPGDHVETQKYFQYGGLINNGAAGRTGDILVTTTGLGSGDSGHLIIYIKKRDED